MKRETVDESNELRLLNKGFGQAFLKACAVEAAEREDGVAPPPHKLLKKFDQNFSAICQCEYLCQQTEAPFTQGSF